MQSNNLVILLQELLKFQEIKELVLFYRKKKIILEKKNQ